MAFDILLAIHPSIQVNPETAFILYGANLLYTWDQKLGKLYMLGSAVVAI